MGAIARFTCADWEHGHRSAWVLPLRTWRLPGRRRSRRLTVAEGGGLASSSGPPRASRRSGCSAVRTRGQVAPRRHPARRQHDRRSTSSSASTRVAAVLFGVANLAVGLTVRAVQLARLEGSLRSGAVCPGARQPRDLLRSRHRLGGGRGSSAPVRRTAGACGRHRQP